MSLPWDFLGWICFPHAPSVISSFPLTRTPHIRTSPHAWARCKTGFGHQSYFIFRNRKYTRLCRICLRTTCVSYHKLGQYLWGDKYATRYETCRSYINSCGSWLKDLHNKYTLLWDGEFIRKAVCSILITKIHFIRFLKKIIALCIEIMCERNERCREKMSYRFECFHTIILMKCLHWSYLE